MQAVCSGLTGTLLAARPLEREGGVLPGECGGASLNASALSCQGL